MAHYKHLTYEERSIIGHYRMRQFSLREIGRRMNRSVSTISRELKRNNRSQDGKYRAFHADSNYNARKSRARRGTNFSPKDWKLVLESSVLAMKLSINTSGMIRNTGESSLRSSEELAR